MAQLGGVLGGLAGLTAGALFVGLIVWLVRGIADHRRWSRLLATQVALHTKFADRLTTNEEVLNYVKTPAVARFLEAGPVVEGPVQRPGPVVSRIVWPLQAGVVLFTLGLGLWLVRGLVLEEVASGFAVAGIIVMTLGLGFVAAAIVAHLVSAQFGLAPERRQ